MLQKINIEGHRNNILKSLLHDLEECFTFFYFFKVNPQSSALGTLLTQQTKVEPTSPPPLIAQVPQKPLPAKQLSPPVILANSAPGEKPKFYLGDESNSPKPSPKPAPPGATVCKLFTDSIRSVQNTGTDNYQPSAF